MGKFRFSFGHYLFLSVTALYCVFVGAFLYYQYHREKAHKIALLTSTLEQFNVELHEHLKVHEGEVGTYIAGYARRHTLDGLRVTLVDSCGHVLYDNEMNGVHQADNHLARKEIQDAMRHGHGYSLKRSSSSLGQPYFYTANWFADDALVVRSALPYNAGLIHMLNADQGYLWYAILLSAILLLIFYNLTARLGHMIESLRDFACRADQDCRVNMHEMRHMGNSDLGEISRHIIDMYARLRKAKDELQGEREKLIAHLQVSNEGLAIFNKGRDVVLSNGLFMQYVNLIADSNVSAVERVYLVKELRPLFDFVEQESREQHRMELRHKSVVVDKNSRVLRLSVALFCDDSFELSVCDITQQEEQSRMKQQITQNIAHELKTPVSSIQGYMETILRTPDLQPALLHKFVERSYAQSNRLANLLHDISLLTRITEATDMIDVDVVDLRGLIDGIVADLQPNLQERGMTATVQLPAILIVEGNQSLLYSIFRNLMDNAIAYAGQGSHIRLVCYSEDATAWYFSFSDDGVGVPPEHLTRLFERFYRVDKGRSRKLGGTGLGLAIVKNAVAFHGGSINAKPGAGGQGLEFLFSLCKHHGTPDEVQPVQ